MIDYKKIYNQLPASWNELKLKDFQKVVDVEISERDEMLDSFIGTDNTLKLISKLTDTPVDRLEELPLFQVAYLSKKLEFISELPSMGKTSVIKWKNIEEISYNDYVTFQNLQHQPLQNLSTIIKAFSKNDMTEEQIGELGMEEIMTGFFLLQKVVKKYITNTKRSLIKKLIKQTIKEKIMKLQPFKQKTIK